MFEQFSRFVLSLIPKKVYKKNAQGDFFQTKVMKKSAKALYGLVEALYTGQHDSILVEVVENLGQNTTGQAMFLYPKFSSSEKIVTVFEREEMQEKNRLLADSLAADPAPEEPPTIAPPQLEPGLAPAIVEDGGEVPDEETAKENTLVTERRVFAKKAVGDAVKLLLRPTLKDDYINLFKESVVISNRTRLAPDGVPAKHGWIYCPGSDGESVVGDKSHRSAHDKRTIGRLNQDDQQEAGHACYSSCYGNGTGNTRRYFS